MIKAVPFILTSGNDRFKEFLNQKFSADMLYPIFNDASCETLFEGWRGKNMVNWYRFTSDDKIILEFYPKYCTLRKDVPNEITYTLPIPSTINDFIDIISKFGIQLYWTDWIDRNFEPKEYLQKDEIKTYFTELLGRMGKSHELL